MATFFSNQFAAAGTETASFNSAYRASQGDLGGHVVYSIARTTTDGTANADDFRMIRGVHSSARLFSLTAQVASTPSAGVIDIGLHLSGFNHDGAVVDIDVFEDGQSITSGLAEADVFTGATLTALDRGKTLWELAAIGAASYTSDPNVLFDITLSTPTGIVTATPVEIMIVAGFLQTD